MKGKQIHLGKGLSLPAEDFLEAKCAIIGQSGKGKSGLVKVIEEELIRVGLPFVAFDVTGIAWGLRSSIDGKGPGEEILVIGGKHGDFPLDSKKGVEVAEAIVKANVSVVIDFSGLPRSQYRAFVKDFSDRLFQINDTSRLVILDEAKELLPQRIRSDQTGVYDSVERLVSQGRNQGIGVLMITQRPATLNKDVLEECSSLVIFGLLGGRDRKAIHEWVEAWATEEEFKEFEKGLPTLERRECYFWSPTEFGRFIKTRINDFHTLHPDRTHLRRAGLLATKPMLTDVAKIKATLGETLSQLNEDKVEVSQIPGLKSRIRSLEAELADHQRLKSAPRNDLQIAALKSELRAVQTGLKTVEALAEIRLSILRKIRDAAGRVIDEAPVETVAERIERPPSMVRPQKHEPISEEVAVERAVVPVTKPTGGAQRMLRVLASYSDKSMSRQVLGALALIQPGSGTFSDYLSILRRNGHLLENGSRGGRLQVTEDGVFAANNPKPLGVAEVIEGHRAQLSGGARRMFNVLVDAYPQSVSREELGSKAEIQWTSGTFSDYLSLIRRRGLLDESDGIRLIKEIWDGP